jgi:hypothetical protein
MEKEVKTKIIDICLECFKRVKANNIDLVENLTFCRTRKFFQSDKECKTFIFNFYLRWKFGKRLENRPYYQEV